MTTKLTVTIDRDLLPRAKRHARAQGLSLSALIEARLREATGEGPAPGFAARWRGAFGPAERTDPRYEAPARKYL